MRTTAPALVLCLAGCSPSWHLFQPDSWGYRQTIDNPISIKVPKPVEVDIESFSGNVKVRLDRSVETGTLWVVREATHGSGRDKNTGGTRDDIQYTYEIVPGELGPVLKIRAWTEHGKPRFQRAHLELAVPSIHGLTVRTQRGTVTVYGTEGPLFIKTTEGKVTVKTNRTMEREVTIENRRGDIEYRVRGDDSSGDFNCQAIRGAVDFRVRQGRPLVYAGTDHDTLLATVNDGTNPVLLRTVDGDVKVYVLEDAFE